MSRQKNNKAKRIEDIIDEAIERVSKIMKRGRKTDMNALSRVLDDFFKKCEEVTKNG